MTFHQQWGWHQSGCGCPQCCPPAECFPCPPTFPCALRGPIIGVTDGSVAKPGEVGEFLQGQSTGDLAFISGQVTTTIVSPLSLPPGDWDVVAEFAAGSHFVSFGGGLDPLPAGASGPQYINFGIDPGTQSLNYMRGACNTIRVATSVPVLLAYTISADLLATSVSINTGATGAIGFAVGVSARRMR